MAYKATVIQVMIASPNDVAKERQLIPDVFREWNAIHSAERHIVLLPAAWETHAAPRMGDRPQAVINQQVLENCDLLIGVFWTRIGTPTGESVSGTVEEIEKHIQAGKPAMLYFSSVPVVPDSIDPKQYEHLKEFKKKCEAQGLIETYDGLSEFREKLARQLTITINSDSYIQNIVVARDVNAPKEKQGVEIITRTRPIPMPSLTSEAQTLIIEAAKDRAGIVMQLAVTGGTQTH
jgi:hypothetical protein